jgi:hypothetical protein
VKIERRLDASEAATADPAVIDRRYKALVTGLGDRRPKKLGSTVQVC